MTTHPKTNQPTRNLLDPSIDVDTLTPEEIKERIQQFMGVPPPKKTCSYFVYVVLYVPKEDDVFKDKDGKETLIQMPGSTVDKVKYQSCTGMVVALGPDAYKDKTRFPSGPNCKLGDWVSIPRHEGVQIRYRGNVMHWLPDDKVAMVLEDPNYVIRG